MIGFVAKMSWDAVRDALASGAPSILPIGAGAKQHGLHLSLDTDARQAEWLASEAARRCGGLIWPTVNYGFYPGFVSYQGSVSIAENTFRDLVQEIVDSLLEQTTTYVLIVNTGISTIEPLKAAVSRCRASRRVVQHDVYRGPAFCRARQTLMTQDSGSHADEIETSIMLVIDPAMVDFARATPSPTGNGLAPGKLTPHNPASPNYSPSGSIGDPRLATPELGRNLLAAISEDLEFLLGDRSKA